MNNEMKKEEKFILAGIPVLFILGSLNHFLFEWSGDSVLVGCFSPVNECIWEHGKLGLIPAILWFSLYLPFNKGIDRNGWFAALTSAIIVEIVTIPMLYYFYTGALGAGSLIVDILIYLVAVVLGQVVAIHAYRRWTRFPVFATSTACLLIVLIYVMYTFYPPELPMFFDGNTGTYGIFG